MEISCIFYTGFKSDKYIASITGISITAPRTLIRSVKGHHEEGKTHDDVVGVCFRESEVHYFPHGLGEVFPNLTHLKIRHCGLKEMCREDFKGLEKLEELGICHNPIRTLNDDLLYDLKNLERLVFTNNKLQCLSSKLFEVGRKKIRIADFRWNSGINEYFGRGGIWAFLQGFLDVIDQKCIIPSACAIKMDVLPLLKAMESLMTSEMLADYTLVADDGEVKVHKSILAAASDFFNNIYINPQYDQDVYNFEGFSAECIGELVHFIYTGELKSNKNTFDLVRLAKRLKMPALTDLCEILIYESITEENVEATVEFARANGLRCLQQTAFLRLESYKKAKLTKIKRLKEAQAAKAKAEADKAEEDARAIEEAARIKAAKRSHGEASETEGTSRDNSLTHLRQKKKAVRRRRVQSD